MGYTTEFRGAFRVSPQMSPKHAERLRKFFKTPHNDKEYPGTWCDYGISKDGQHLFPLCGRTMHFIDWLYYLKENYLDSWGYSLSGVVLWKGENLGDAGDVEIIDGTIYVTWLWKDLDEIVSRLPHSDAQSPVRALDFVKEWSTMRRFEIDVSFSRGLSQEHEKWLQDFCRTIHFARKSSSELDVDPLGALEEKSKCMFLTCTAKELRGETFFEDYMIEHPRLITDRTLPVLRESAAGCPDLFCQWTAKKGSLAFDGNPCFSRPVEWLVFLIDRFFAPNGYVLNGRIRWSTDSDFYDCGTIFIKDNRVSAYALPFLKPTDDDAVDRVGAY